MSALILTIIIGVVSLFAFLIYLKYSNDAKIAKSEIYIKLNILDFNRNNNFYDMAILSVGELKIIREIFIKENNIQISFLVPKKKEILDGSLTLTNSQKKNIRKNFKIKIYNNCANIINIKINNSNSLYYNAEIIFYCKNSIENIKLNDNLEYNTHNTTKRCRLMVYNMAMDELSKIIKDNINDLLLKNKALDNIAKNSNKLLLINIYIDNSKSNILIFIEDEKALINPNEQERQFFADFYREIWQLYFSKQNYNNNSLAIGEKYQNEILQKKEIFGKKIDNLNDSKNTNILFSFINQGINCLLENNIISKTQNNSDDLCFMFGYILFYSFIIEKQNFEKIVGNFFNNLNKCAKKNFSDIDLIKIAISYVIFSTNNITISSLKFRDDLKRDDPYYKGFEFFENIISDLNEESDLMFIYLQINSGSGLNLINNENCLKISMLSIEEIKSHIIKNIPKYFYTFNSFNGDYIMTDARTQIMIFNEKKIFEYPGSNNNTHNNNIMNVTLGMFHESGHEKFHMNSKIGGDRSPLFCIDKNFDLIRREHWFDQNRGESGKFIDYYLYNSPKDDFLVNLMDSSRSNELMDKSYFTGDLSKLNNISKNIISSTIKSKIQGQNNSSNVKNSLSSLTSSKDKRNPDENEELYKKLREIGADVSFLKKNN